MVWFNDKIYKSYFRNTYISGSALGTWNFLQILLDANIGGNVNIEKEKFQNQMKTQFFDKLLQLACNRQIATSCHNIFNELNFQRL